jgi:hypothetical protein
MLVRVKWAASGAVAGIVLAVIVFFSLRNIGARDASTSRTVDAPAVVHELQRLSELVSVKYTIQKVVGLEEKKSPLGSEKLLLFVQAEALGGIDLSTLGEKDVQVLPGKQVRIALPAAKIVHIVIDDRQTKVWDRRITWWTPWVPYNPDLERQARLQAAKEIEQAALQMGILDQARRNAEAGVGSLLETLGVKSVSFVNRS